MKKYLNEILQVELEPIRKRRKEFEEDIPGLYEILRSGSYNARIIAKNTLEEVRDAIGINYFKQL